MNIQRNFEEIMIPLEEQVASFPWGDKEAYANWVAQTYHFVLHSTRLFACASSRCDLSTNKIHFKLLEHLSEEKGHENLGLHDLKALKCQIKDLPELPETASLYQIQYYWIEHFSPSAFFGYLLCLEGLAVRAGKAAYEKAVQAHGQRACSFLRVHIEEDEGHLAEVFEYVNQFSEEDLKLVMKNLKQSANLYANMLRHIERLVKARTESLAA